jgi:hypothetical protein
MSNNMVCFMGELLWLNKLQNGDPKEHKKVWTICHNFPFIEVGRPMTNFKGCKDVFDFLEMPNNPQKH